MGFKSVKISRKKLRAFLDRSDKSLAMIAREIGLAEGTVSNWLGRGEVIGIKTDAFPRLLKAVGAEPDDLKANGHAKFPTSAEQLLPAGISQHADIAPVPEWELDVRASAWAPVPVCELNYDDPEQRRVIESGRFRLRIIGACMEPEYRDGQSVEFQLIRIDRDGMELHRDYLICRADNVATFKKLVAQDEDSITLAAINQRQFPGQIVVARQDVVRVARVVFRLEAPPEPKPVKVRATKRR